MSKINILGVNLTVGSKRQIMGEIESIFSGDRCRYLVTVNPEFILGAQTDEEFFYILNRADLAVCDGFGLQLAALMMGKPLSRLTGADLAPELLKLAAKAGRRVLVLNWRGGLSNAAEIAAAIKVIEDKAEVLVLDIDRRGNLLDLEKIKAFAPALALVSLGAPWQEKLIYHKLRKLTSLKLAVGVGGTFDYLTGKVERAPGIARKLGLEWFWRLIRQPKRIRRILNAVVVFPYKFIVWRFILPLIYRDNVVCLLYKKFVDNFRILIVERTGQPGHWQLPQGGTDNEPVDKAGARELTEEIGTDKFQSRASYDKLWHYKFSREKDTSRQFRRHRGYRGQSQGLFIAEFTGLDSDIKIKYWDHHAWRWVEPAKLVETVHPMRRESTALFLEKFYQLIQSSSQK